MGHRLTQSSPVRESLWSASFDCCFALFWTARVDRRRKRRARVRARQCSYHRRFYPPAVCVAPSHKCKPLITRSFISRGIHAMPSRWTSCPSRSGGYR